MITLYNAVAPRMKGRAILAGHYFIYFGVMGAYLPYFNLYCHQLGFSGWQIGSVSAARSFVLILFTVFWSILADRYQARRPLYILCNIAAAALWGLFLFFADFYWILALSILYGIFFAPIIAFLEAFTMDLLNGQKKRYGGIRAWGSLAFITVVLVLGRMVDAYGVRLVLIVILAGSWIQALLSLGIPKSASKGDGFALSSWHKLASPRLVVFWFCGFLMLLSHGAYYGFFSIHLSQLGFGSGFIGVCWAIASCAEILIMLNSERLFKRFSYEWVLMAAFWVALIRWAGLWTAQTTWLIVLLQLTHTVTYGAFHMASILYTDHWAPKESKTLAQAVNNAVTYGLGLMAGFFLSGFFYDRLGASAMFLFNSLIAGIGGVCFSVFLMAGRKGRQGV